jgi:hypothetical protein
MLGLECLKLESEKKKRRRRKSLSLTIPLLHSLELIENSSKINNKKKKNKQTNK